MMASWSGVSAQGTYKGREYVDLGLPSGNRWAAYNIGASDEYYQYADLFAWGETQEKDIYDWSSYKYCEGTKTTLTKYNGKSNSGAVDNLTELEARDDAARVAWGGAWRVPTIDDVDELLKECEWTWDGTHHGYEVKGPNGNTIFLTAQGLKRGSSVEFEDVGYYWTSSVQKSYPMYAYALRFDENKHEHAGSGRSDGLLIRPVYNPADAVVTPTDKLSFKLWDGEIIDGESAMGLEFTMVLQLLLNNNLVKPVAIDDKTAAFHSAEDKLLFEAEMMDNNCVKISLGKGVTSADNIAHDATDDDRAELSSLLDDIANSVKNVELQFATSPELYALSTTVTNGMVNSAKYYFDISNCLMPLIILNKAKMVSDEENDATYIYSLSDKLLVTIDMPFHNDPPATTIGPDVTAADNIYYELTDEDRAMSTMLSSVKSIQVIFVDDPTGINRITTTNTNADAQRYNLQGQRVGKDFKGIVVVGGKKMILK